MQYIVQITIDVNRIKCNLKAYRGTPNVELTEGFFVI